MHFDSQFNRTWGSKPQSRWIHSRSSPQLLCALLYTKDWQCITLSCILKQIFFFTFTILNSIEYQPLICRVKKHLVDCDQKYQFSVKPIRPVVKTSSGNLTSKVSSSPHHQGDSRGPVNNANSILSDLVNEIEPLRPLSLAQFLPRTRTFRTTLQPCWTSWPSLHS